MGITPHPLSLTSADSHEARALVRQHWEVAARVDALVMDTGWLCKVVGQPERHSRSTLVRLICQRPPPNPWPTQWQCWVTDLPAAPDFILFYQELQSVFPDSAAVFAGRPGHRWLSLQQQPLVLYRLREHFNSLIDQVACRDAVAATAIREPGSSFKSISREPHADDNQRPEHISPQELYRQVLAAHFAALAATGGEDADQSLSLAAHQMRAFERACDILDRYSGVIVADAVGLGKSYVGLRILKRELDAGRRVLVIVPAALREQWRRDLANIGTGQPGTAEPGSVTDAVADRNLELWVREAQQSSVTLVSMESLGRRAFDPLRHRGVDLVIVDEAHNFRNSATRRHKNLADMTRHCRVVLLTATPVNNSLFDLQHLIDLFAAPGAFRHLGISDYRDAFRRAAVGEADVTPIISACVLRRTRRFLRRHYGEVRVSDPKTGLALPLRFPKRRQPTAVEYDLAGIYGDLFRNLDAWLSDLRFDSIATDSESGKLPVPLGSLLKMILLKRLESSVEAFRSTVFQQLAWCKTALSALAAGRVLTRPDYRASFRGPADDPGSQLTFFELVLPATSISAERLNEFRQSLEHDLGILTRVYESLTSVGFGGDRKLERLLELLDGPLAGRKILLFTEFRDTARYIHHRLRQRPYLAQIDSGGGRLGLQPASRQEVIERFAPISNGVPEPTPRERVNLLIATDVLSEGLNLQDASIVVSYDLPWNPVRLMQRMGRIDRLGAISDTVELHHFVPTRDLERLLGLLQRLRGKISTITDTIGLDRPVLATPNDDRRVLSQIRLLASVPDGYERLEKQLEGPFDPEEQAYLDHVAHGRTVEPSPGHATVLTAAVNHAGLEKRAAAYWRVRVGGHHRGIWLICDVETGCVVEDQSQALALFRFASREKGTSASRYLLDHVRRSCARHARSMLERLRTAQIAGDALHPALPQCRIAVRLSRQLEDGGLHIPSDQRVLIDDLLQRLMRRFTRAGERRLAQLADLLPEQLDQTALASIDGSLAEIDAEHDAGLELSEVATLLVLPGNTPPS